MTIKINLQASVDKPSSCYFEFLIEEVKLQNESFLNARIFKTLYFKTITKNSFLDNKIRESIICKKEAI